MSVLVATGVFAALPPCVAAPPIADPLRVDLGADTRRGDTSDGRWIEWQWSESVPRCDFGPLTLTLRAGNDSTALRGSWWKKGLATGAVMATDGVVASASSGSAVLELVIEGLAPGRHGVATWHNHFEEPAPESRTIEVAGTGPAVAAAAIDPTWRVARDADAAVAFTEVVAPDGGSPVVVRISATSGSGPDGLRVVLNGFEIGGSDPRHRAAQPWPTEGDGHADADDGRIELRWRPAPSAVRHEVFVARASTRAEAIAGASAATPAASLAVADTTDAARYVVEIPRHARALFHAWRVDGRDGEGRVTRGRVWWFRPRQLAFPGAEGHGRFAVGGRGGRVIKVTTLEDGGPGSLRAAVEAEGPRTVVFDVSGRIRLRRKLIIRNPFLTLAGQTAPGKGICLSDHNLGLMGTHDVIVRFLRVRPGDVSGETLDGMGMASSNHCIIDHCSISWTIDEGFSSRGAGNITLQRTLISEALNIAGHRKYPPGTAHGYAASIGGDIGSFHHNLLAHCAGRNWSLAGGLDQAAVHAGRLDIRNNVVFNWSHRTTDGGARQVQFVNNYYRPGPASRVFHLLKPERNPHFGPQDYFVAGNVMEGRFGPDEPHAGIVEPPAEPLASFVKSEPFFEAHVTTEPAAEAFESVLADVGCNVPELDDHDRRVIDEVRSGTAAHRGSRSGLPGLPDSQADVGGWEDYPEVHRPADWDVDGDGMPGAWEAARGLDPHDPADGPIDPDGDGSTHLEEYLAERAVARRRNPAGPRD